MRIALERKRYAYSSSTPAASAGTDRSQVEKLPVFDDGIFNADVAQKVKPPGMFCNLIEFEYLGGEHLPL